MEKIRLLAIGENAADFAAQLYEGAIVESADLKPSKQQKDYDVIIAYNCLNRLPFRKVVETTKDWLAALKPGGEMAILFPSLEWAAEQILSGQPSPALLLHLFGSQQSPKQFYSCGFTLMEVRGLCSEIGLKVTHSATGEYRIGDEICQMHTIRGTK